MLWILYTQIKLYYIFLIHLERFKSQKSCQWTLSSWLSCVCNVRKHKECSVDKFSDAMQIPSRACKAFMNTKRCRAAYGRRSAASYPALRLAFAYLLYLTNYNTDTLTSWLIILIWHYNKQFHFSFWSNDKHNWIEQLIQFFTCKI